MNLLIAIIVVTFVCACHRDGTTRPIRPVPLALVCAVLAVAYMSQRVI